MPDPNTTLPINPKVPSEIKSYPERFDAETRAYIALSKTFTAQNDTPGEIRNSYLAFCERITPSGQGATRREDSTLIAEDGAVPIRRYTPGTRPMRQNAQILFFHGGGFVVGNLDSHDACCARFAEESGMSVIAVDYRLAPEHRFPAAFEDCLAIYQHLCNTSSTPIILCGDSAGGTLAAAISVYCRDHNIPLPIGQLLIYPYLGSDPSAGSYQRHRDAPLLSLEDLIAHQRCYHGDTKPTDDPRALPLRAWQYANLPPTVSIAAEIDPLADDSVLYCQHLQAAGVAAHCDIAHGLPHGFLRAWTHIAKVEACWTRIGRYLENLARGQGLLY